MPSVFDAPAIPRSFLAPSTSVSCGPPDDACVPLSALADPSYLALLPLLPRPERRREGVGVLHRALVTVTHAILGPLAVDAVGLKVRADDLGDRIVPGGAATVWARRWQLSVEPDPVSVAATQVTRLLWPVAENVRCATGLPRTFVDRYLSDQVASRAERLARRHPPALPADWPLHLLRETGFGHPHDLRRLAVDPDGAGNVDLVLPRVCCSVTGPTDPRDSCPTCPLLPDHQVRAERSRRWLMGLPDEEFRDVVGRPRR